jgi:hypothetical protein
MRRSRAVCRLRAQAGRKALVGGRYLDMGYGIWALGYLDMGYGIWALGYSLHVYFAHHLMHCRLRSIVFLGNNL